MDLKTNKELNEYYYQLANDNSIERLIWVCMIILLAGSVVAGMVLISTIS